MNPNKSYWRTFFILNLLAALLLASWHFTFTRHYWDLLDTQIFYYLNGWVATNHIAQIFWAITNYRPFDIITFLLLLASISVANFFVPKKDIKTVAILFFVSMLVLLTLRFSMNAIYHLDRRSPSLVLPGAYLLKSLVPYISTKDSSGTSFPGDHASVIFVWLGFMLLFAKPNYKIVAILLGVFFSLPRLVAGAHWFSDDMVGGLFIALVTMAWVCFTPLAKYSIKGLMPILNWCLTLTPKFMVNLTFERS